ncbi:MAG: hypothetical protein JOY90_03965, partial [Bradyrhizobium sp.]|nr:hypothetical protein [Bradyrhizobium sp.]
TLRQRIKWLVACFGAAAVTAVVVGAPWHFEIWQRFGNPFYPLFNGIFHASGFEQSSFRDQRFLPHSIFDIWRYPLYWLTASSPNPEIGSPSAEIGVRDVRWIVVVCGCTVFLAALAALGNWRRRVLSEPATGLLLTFVLGYLVWLATFAIHRYMVVLEILCGAALLILALQLGRNYLTAIALTALAACACLTAEVPDWGRVPWKPYWQAINPKPLDIGGNNVVFVAFKPALFAAASLPPDTRYIDIGGEFDVRANSPSPLTEQVKALMARSGVQLKELDDGQVREWPRSALDSYGLVATNRCQPLQVADVKMRLCDLERRR